MSQHYSAEPCDINLYRKLTDSGYSSGGVRMTRKCCRCGKSGYPNGYKKVAGTGSSRHNPAQYECPECQ